MAWEPSVLRKYNTTGHFRLLNQLRTELRGNPLVRPKEGQSIGEVNRSKSLIRAIEGRSQGYGRGRRGGGAGAGSAAAPATVAATLDLGSQAGPALSSQGPSDHEESGSASFRKRLNAIDLR